MALERMPGSDTDWKRVHQGNRVQFENIQVDPETGVTTTWTKDLKYFSVSRLDQIPGLPYSRFISQRAEPSPLSKRTIHVINQEVNGIYRSFDLDIPEGSIASNLHIRITDNSEASQFCVEYNGNNLSTINLMRSSFDYLTVLRECSMRSFKDNLEKLGELYRVRGAIMTFNPYIGIIHGELDDSQREYLDYEESDHIKKVKEIMKHWTDEACERARVTVATVVNKVVALHLGTSTQQADLTIISSALMEDVLEDLPLDFDAIENPVVAVEKISKLLVDNTVRLLAANREAYDSLSDLDIEFTFDKEDHEAIEVSVANTEPAHKGSLRINEHYRYEDYDYHIYRDDRGNISVEVQRILQPARAQQITVSEEIDFGEVTRLITMPESLGWERVLDAVKVDYLRYG